MDSTFPGGRPLPTGRSDVARLDFAEGARAFVMYKMLPVVSAKSRAALDAALDASSFPANEAPLADDEAYRVLRGLPIIPVGHRMMRSVQEMIFRGAHRTLHKRRAELLAELDRADEMGPGSVEYDPDFRFPDYFTNQEFHLQQGGYDDPLGGYVYHLGGNVFHSGKNERAEANRKLVAMVPTPPDGKLDRILELGCSTGVTSGMVKERFPKAELWSTDITAPMVRYAHKRAVDLGLDIHFKQMAAEEITFPDNSFDLVYANILYHEMPAWATQRSFEEAYRVLRPGGLFAFCDIRDHTQVDPGTETALARYTNGFQRDDNEEPYFLEFFECDTGAMLRAAGFRNVNSNYAPTGGVWAPSLMLPLRVGEK
jgi:ubiquinone/menaquinone biosynthesis C-methylase UbiE